MAESKADSGAGVGDFATPLPIATVSAATTPLPTGVVSKRRLKATDCPVEAVTVFVDRAEVVRGITLQAADIGQHDIIVEGLTDLVVSDSVRYGRLTSALSDFLGQNSDFRPVVFLLQCRFACSVAGVGHCKILEVSNAEEDVPEEDKSAEVSELQAQIDALNEQLSALGRSQAIVQQNSELITKYVTCMHDWLLRPGVGVILPVMLAGSLRRRWRRHPLRPLPPALLQPRRMQRSPSP